MKNRKRMTEERLRWSIEEALRAVNVPGIEKNVYDLGMVEEIRIIDDEVHLTFNPKSNLCSGLQLAFDVRRAVKSVGGIRRVELHVHDSSMTEANGAEPE